MKKGSLAFLMIFAVFLFGSCYKQDVANPDRETNGLVFKSTIAENAGSNQNQVMAGGTEWSANDAIGIFMSKAGQGFAAGALLAENKQHVTENGGANGVFVAANSSAEINFPEDGSNVDFVAYYPFKASLTNYQFPVDVSDQSSQAVIDLLHSSNAANKNKTSSDVALTFQHKLSKVVFNVSSSGIADLSDLSIAIQGTKTKASYNLAGGDNALVVDDNSTANILAKTAANGEVGEAIIIPSGGATDRSFAFSLPSGSVYTWPVPASTSFEKGKKYTYNVQLQQSGSGGGSTITLQVSAAVIEDWIDAPAESIVALLEEQSGPTTGSVPVDQLYGYGQATTGGEGGTVYHFDNGKKFRDWLGLREKNKSTDPVVVWLSGTFTKDDGRAASSPWFDIKRTSNITIYGVNGFKMQNVGFFLNEAQNIIIRNIYIVMPKADNGADGISMQESERVWVDHCTFESVNQTSDYEDGSCDITHGTKNVTVSWNHFIKTQKSSLVGHSNSQTSDVQITATYHHNYFDLSSSRHPRVRFGTVHVYNNFYNQVSTYGVGSAYGAKVLVENNSFDGVRLPTDICTYPAKPSGSSYVSNLEGSVAGYLFAADNVYTNIPANASNPYPFTNVEFKAYQGEQLAQPLTRADFTPSYSYIVDRAEDLNTIVPANAGAGKLSRFATAPIPVDNGGMPEPGDGGDDGGDPGNTGTDLGGGWFRTDVGTAAGTATIGAGNTSITMTGKGKFESGAQTFNFVYKELTGDFEITAQLDNFTTLSTTNQAEAGILLTPDASKSATDLLFAFSAKGGNSGYNYSHRLATATNAARGLMAAAGAETTVILKLQRTGNAYFASYSTDGGATFSTAKTGTFTSTLPDKLYVGLLVNSGSASDASTATFSNIKINGVADSFGN